MKMILPLAVVCCLVASVAPAQQTGAPDGADRFQWSWERSDGKPGTEPVEGGVDPAAYDKAVGENLRLRKENGGLARSLDEMKGINTDLALKIKALEKSVAEHAAAPDGVPASAAPETNDIEKILEDNLSLQVEVNKLKTDIETLQKRQTGDSLALVSPDSDLFKRALQDNAALKSQIQKMRQAGQESVDARAALADADKRWSEKVDEQKEQIRALQNDNSELKKLSLALQLKSDNADASAEKLASLRAEVEQKVQALEAQEKTIKRMEQEQLALRARAEQAQVKAVRDAATVKNEGAVKEAAGAEKADLLFNMGVLYTMKGMYSEAEQQFLEVLRMQPSAADAHYNIAVLYDKHLADRKKAGYHYKKFLELDPLNTEADKVKLWILELEMAM